MKTSVINFEGNGVNATRDGETVTVNIPGGGDVASLVDAQAGIDNTKTMTPLRVSQVAPRIYNIKAYGALGDGRVAVGGINSSSSTLTATTSVFNSGMVGQSIEIPGAGAAGVELITTIAAYISSTQVTITTPASTTVTGKRIWCGTDDTAAIQSAINACFAAGGGKIRIPNGIYIINGALVTSDVNGLNPNSQLYIPASFTTTTNYTPISIEIEGESWSHSWLSTIPIYGTVLKSMKRTGTGTRPAVIGGIGEPVNNLVANWNTTPTTFKNIGILMDTNGGYSTSNMIGLNGLNFTNISAINLGIRTDCDVTDTNLPTPAGSGFTGAIFGKKDNIIGGLVDNVSVLGGFEYNVVFGGELISFRGLGIYGGIYGATFLNTNFQVQGDMTVTFCNHMLYFPNASIFGSTAGSSWVDITMGFETSGIQTPFSWYNPQSFVNDAGNNARGIVRVVQQDGDASVFSNIGAKYLNIQALQESYSDNKYYPQDGISAYYDFSESSGTRADGSGYANSLTPNGTVTRVAGNLSTAYAVNLPYGANYLEGGNSNTQSASSVGFTFGTWFKMTYGETNSGIAGKWASGQKEWMLYYSGAELRFAITADGSTNYVDMGTGGGSFTADSLWHYITCQWNGASIIITVDGEILATQVANSMFKTGTANFSIGKDLLASGAHFVAYYQFPTIWRRSLSISEIRYLINAGVGRARPDYKQKSDYYNPNYNLPQPQIIQGMLYLGQYANDAAADAATPSGTALKGSMYYNTTSDKVKVKENASWKTVTTS